MLSSRNTKTKVALVGGICLCLASVSCTPWHSNGAIPCPSNPAYVGPPLRAAVTLSDQSLMPAASSGLSTAETVGLNAAFRAAFDATAAHSMTAAVWQTGGQTWTQQEGAGDDQLHYWASVGKIITAATIIRLQADGRLSLDLPISEFVEDVPNGNTITLRMLLNHTSGLFSANEDPQVRSTHAALDLPTMIEVLNRRGPYSCPGSYWRYSNSGYTLLGAVIEKVTGEPYHQAATRLVLSRSNAQHLRMLAPDDSLADVAPISARDGAIPFNPTHPQAAGGVVADADSMLVFMRDLFTGQILPDRQLQSMFQDLYPMADPGLWYGFGVMVYDVPGPKDELLWLGHSGGVDGARAVVAYVPSRGAIVAVALVGEGSAEASANLLLSALEHDR